VSRIGPGWERSRTIVIAVSLLVVASGVGSGLEALAGHSSSRMVAGASADRVGENRLGGSGQIHGAGAPPAPASRAPSGLSTQPRAVTPFSSPHVADTLVLLNNTVFPGNFLAGNGGGPTAAAYDSGKGEVFVANVDSNNVSVINDSTDVVVATIPVQESPEGIAYDSVASEIFVTDYDSNNVSVINDTTNAIVATIPVAGGPWGVAYDQVQGTILVTQFMSTFVSVINTTTNTVMANIAVGSDPAGIAYDSGNLITFVANLGSNNVSVLAGRTDAVLRTVGVGGQPEGVA